jgi:hypothetical protein
MAEEKYRWNKTDHGIRSRYKATPPDGGPAKIVTLTNEAVKRYKEKGWTFVRTTLRDYNA